MEGPHRQLRARLTDALGSHDTDRLTTANQMTTSQITAIAGCANSVPSLTGHCGADADMVHVMRFKDFHAMLINHLASSKQGSSIARTDHIFRHGAAQDTIVKRDNNLAALNDGFSQDAMLCAAILFSDHQILTNIDQPSCQVPGVSCLQRGIRETFSGTVG